MMNDFDYSITVHRLIIHALQIYYRFEATDSGVELKEQWNLKYPN